MANLLQSGVASAERVFEVLDAEEEPTEEGGSLPAEVQGRVAFEHVSFSYTPDRPLITDLSLAAAPGSTVAIVGPTGAGKTTLVNLILRFYDLDAGLIRVDGVDIASIPRRTLRSEIGMVLQDTWLAGPSATTRLRPPRRDRGRDRRGREGDLRRPVVRSLPDGYDTVINDEATNLSAGEKQLITIARAFLSDPSLLISTRPILGGHPHRVAGAAGRASCGPTAPRS